MSITRKPNGAYRVSVDEPRLPGEPRKQHTRTAHTLEEAQRIEASLLRRVGKLRPATKGTLAAALRDWIESNTWRPTTRSDYVYRFEAYVIPHIGHLPVVTATEPTTIAGLYRKLKREGGRNGKPLADATVKAVHISLTCALRDIIGKDAVSEIKSPSGRATNDRRQKRDPRKRGRRGIWTRNEAMRFLAYCAEDKPGRLYCMWSLAIGRGMRRGEICGLRWRDIDWDKGIIYIGRQRVTASGVPGGVYEDEPKRGSFRPLPLTGFVRDALKIQREHYLSERERLGARFEGEDYVFTSPRRGRPYYPDYVTHRFVELAARAGLPRISLHDLRHTNQSVLHAGGVEVKTSQDWLGHSSADMSLHYTHTLDESIIAAAGIIDDAFGDIG